MRRAHLNLLLVLLLSEAAFAKTFRIAGIYAKSHVGHASCTCGLEAICISRAAVQKAKREGMSVSFDVIGSEWDSISARDAATKVANGKYDAAVGTLVSAEALPAAEILEAARIPFIVPTGTHPGITKGKTFVARVPFDDHRQAALLAKLTATKLHPRTAVILRNSSNPYSVFLSEEYARRLKELAPKVSVTEYPIIDGFNDFKGLVGKISTHHPDLIFAPLWQSQVASLYAELAITKPRLTLLSGDTVEGKPAFIKLLGTMEPGIRFIFVSHWTGKLDGPMAAEYQSLHDAHCGEFRPSRASVAAFDAIHLILEAIHRQPTARKQELIAKIKSLEYVGMTGPLIYGAGGEPEKPLELFTFERGKAVYWRRYE